MKMSFILIDTEITNQNRFRIASDEFDVKLKWDSTKN